MRPLDIFFAIAVAALWGGNFVSAKFGVSYFPPFFITSLRFLLVSAALLPFVPRPTGPQLQRIAQLALVLGVLHFALLFAGMHQGLNIAACAIVTQLGTPLSCLLGAIFLKDKLGPWRIFGMIVAFLGIAIVAGTPNILEHPLGFMLAFGGAFFWGVANIVMKRIEGVDIFQQLAWMSLLAVPQLWLLSAIFETDQWPLLLNAPASALLSVAYTAACSTVLAYGLWFHLMKRYPVTLVAPFALLTPVFGIAFGQLFFTEALTWQVMLGGAVTIAGVAVIVIRRPKLLQLGEAT